MTRLSRGFWLAATLILLAIAAPCVAWYIAGSRSVDQQSEQLSRLVRDRGEQIALGLAERLRGRLEAMADAESLRPFYYFQSSYHDPTSTCECSSLSPSPLVAGPQDPFIAIYFQIDSARGLTTPAHESQPLSADQQRLHHDLVAAVPQCLQAVQTPVKLPEPTWSAGELDGEASNLESLVWDPMLRVDPFQWHGVDLATGPALVALRRVESATDRLVQGFVLSEAAVHGWLDAAEWPSQLRPSPDEHPEPLEVQASVPLECAQWEVAVRIDEGITTAQEQSRRIRDGFRRNFAAGSTAAGVSAFALLLVLGWRERSERQRARFAAAAAHELRTPLTGLQLYSEMLDAPGLSDAKRKEYARRVASEAHRLGRVVTNVLAFTGLERGSAQVETRPVDLGAELSRFIPEIRESVELAGARLETPATWPVVRVLADPEATEQILRNLVDNAEKYSRQSDDRSIHLELRANSGRATVEVRDHGPGIAPELGQRIFQAFERGAAPGQPAGLGLGLMLSQELAASQNAELRWRNHPRGGACFELSFPAEP